MNDYSVNINISYETTANSKEEALDVIMSEIMVQLNDGVPIEDIADIDIEALNVNKGEPEEHDDF